MDNFFVDILDINDFITKLGVKEVKVSTLYNRSSSEPHPEGLLSYDIFGTPGTIARKQNYGYINLNGKFVHPKVYKDLVSLKREIFRDLINGVGSFTVENGDVKRVVATDGDMNIPKGQKVGTGIDFLYQIWDEIDFSTTPDTAQQTKETKDCLRILKKHEVFVDKWLVMPAFYRDVDLNTNKRNEYNTYYIRLIELASMLKATSVMFSLFNTSDAHRLIQATLNDIFNQFILNNIGGTKGFIQNNVIGKTTEYSARLVISAGDFNANSPEEAEISFTHSGLPLYAVVKIFLPFIAYGLRQFFFNYFNGNNFIFGLDEKTGQYKRIEIDPTFEDILSIKNLQKRVELFEESKLHRLEPVTVRGMDKKEYPLFLFNGEEIFGTDKITELNDSAINKIMLNETNGDGSPKVDLKKALRPLNWSELFYIIAQDNVSDKICYITRYPIEDYNSIYPSYMNIIPSKKYKKLIINGKVYPRFPDFSSVAGKNLREISNSELSFLFSDTLKLFPSYLSQLKADFDGDQLSVQSLFTEEAKAEAEKFMFSKLNFAGTGGVSVKEFANVSFHGIYGLTRARYL